MSFFPSSLITLHYRSEMASIYMEKNKVKPVSSRSSQNQVSNCFVIFVSQVGHPWLDLKLGDFKPTWPPLLFAMDPNTVVQWTPIKDDHVAWICPKCELFDSSQHSNGNF